MRWKGNKLFNKGKLVAEMKHDPFCDWWTNKVTGKHYGGYGASKQQILEELSRDLKVSLDEIK